MAKKWIQDAKESMKRRGTEGAFAAWCKEQGYGSVTAECIAQGLKSKSPTIRRRAGLAKAFATARKKTTRKDTTPKKTTRKETKSKSTRKSTKTRKSGRR